jgi:hypothetical protein
MTLFYNFTKDSVQTGIERIVKTTFKLLRDQGIAEKEWDGDKIQIKNQFPSWVQKEYAANPTSAPVIDFFTYYYRWLFDYSEGYGMGFYLEDLRDILYVPDAFLQAYADLVFSGNLNFGAYPGLVTNFRRFYMTYDVYTRIRGTQEGMAYILKSLFGVTTVSIVVSAGGRYTVTSDLNPSYQSLFKTLACPFSFEITFEPA